MVLTLERPHELPEKDISESQIEIDNLSKIQVKTQIIRLTNHQVPIARIKKPQNPLLKNTHESIYIVRRLDNETISANAMYKAAYPNFKDQDLDQEMAWLEKLFPNKLSQRNKLAGVWIPLEAAEILAQEYEIKWLCDPLFKMDPASLNRKIVSLIPTKNIKKVSNQSTTTLSSSSSPVKRISPRSLNNISPTKMSTQSNSDPINFDETKLEGMFEKDFTKKIKQRKILIAKGVPPGPLISSTEFNSENLKGESKNSKKLTDIVQVSSPEQPKKVLTNENQISNDELGDTPSPPKPLPKISPGKTQKLLDVTLMSSPSHIPKISSNKDEKEKAQVVIPLTTTKHISNISSNSKPLLTSKNIQKVNPNEEEKENGNENEYEKENGNEISSINIQENSSNKGNDSPSQVLTSTNKRSRSEDLEQELRQEKRKVRVLFGLVVGLGASAILPHVL